MVLLVDDDDNFRNGVAEHLRDDGHEVTEWSGAEKLPAFDSLGAASILITDYQMKGEDGLALAKRFHESHPKIPIILATAYSSEYLETACSTSGFIHLLRKPIDYDILHQTLHHLAIIVSDPA